MATPCPECTEEECKKQALKRLKAAQEKAKDEERAGLKSILGQKDLNWKTQFDNLLEDIDKKYCVTEECFDKLFEEVTKKFKLEFGDVCEDNQNGVIVCYKEKRTSPLLCQKTVQDYTDCVNETSRSTVENAAKEDDKKKEVEKKPVV